MNEANETKPVVGDTITVTLTGVLAKGPTGCNELITTGGVVELVWLESHHPVYKVIGDPNGTMYRHEDAGEALALYQKVGHNQFRLIRYSDGSPETNLKSFDLGDGEVQKLVRLDI